MRTRQKRIIVKGKEEKGKQEIKKRIVDTGMTFVLINNGLFDEFYCKESVIGIKQTKIEEEGNPRVTKWEAGETKFSELEMVTYIFLQFMMVNKITLNYEDFANYIGCSSRQLKVALKRLKLFKGKCNAKYNSYKDNVIILEDSEKEVFLITEKEHMAYSPTKKKSIKTMHWYTNYIPNYKAVKKDGKEELVPENFFMITIDDFDLLTNGTLTRNEFITYLFLLKAHKYGTDDDKQMWWSYSRIAETMNYRLPQTIQGHIEKLLETKINDIPLIEEIRPNNYDLKVQNDEEPASKFIPRFNPVKMMEMDSQKKEVSFQKKEMSFNKVEMDLLKVETSFQKEEVNSSNMEMDLLNEEMDLRKKEVNNPF